MTDTQIKLGVAGDDGDLGSEGGTPLSSDAIAAALPDSVETGSPNPPPVMDTTEAPTDGQYYAFSEDSGMLEPTSPTSGGLNALQLGTDVWWSADSPGTVTDWGPVINGLVGSGARRLYFGEHDFPFTTLIDLYGAVGVIWEGAGGSVFPSPGTGGQLSPTRLIWQGGEGSGAAITCAVSDGFTIRDMAVVYVATSGYDGDLVSHVGSNSPCSANFLAERAFFGLDDQDSAVKTAKSLVNLANSVNAKLDTCALQGATSLVRGAEAVSDFATDAVFIDCEFSLWGYASITNPQYPWRFNHCTWEFTDAGSLVAFDTDIGTAESPNSTHLVLDDCWFWDGVTAGEMIINQRVGQEFRVLDIRGGFFGICPDSGVPWFNLQGPITDFSLIGGDWQLFGGGAGPFIDLGPAATAYKARARIDTEVFGTGQYVANTKGHGDLSIRLPMVNAAESIQTTQVETVAGYRRLSHPLSPPAVAVHAGASGVNNCWLAGNFDQGTPLAGIVIADLTAADGLVVDVTFAETLYPHGKFGDDFNQYTKPIVMLTPIQITAGGSGALGAEPTNAIATSGYASVENVALATGVTGFSIGVAASTTGRVAWAYQVILA